MVISNNFVLSVKQWAKLVEKYSAVEQRGIVYFKKMGSLKINHTILSFEELRLTNLPVLQKHFTGFDHALEFCKAWLSGEAKFIINTSGSTGIPKAIEINRQQMAASAAMTATALGLKMGDSSFICLDTRYIGGLMMLVRGLELKMQMNLALPVSDPLSTLKDSDQFDFAAFVPMQLHAYFKNKTQFPLDHIQAIIIGGAPLDAQLLNHIQKIKPSVYHTYGMTETVSHIALKKLNGPNAPDFFTALSDVNLSVDGRDCLVIESEICTNGKVITNDIVELLSANTFRWLGRYDNVINSGGLKIQPQKVENALAAMAILQGQNMFISSQPDASLGQKIVLAIEGKPWKVSKKEEVIINLKNILNKHEIPKAFIFIEKFEYTRSGKVDQIQTIKKYLSLKC